MPSNSINNGLLWEGTSTKSQRGPLFLEAKRERAFWVGGQANLFSRAVLVYWCDH